MGWFTKKKKGETTEEELQEVQTQETVAEAEEVEYYYQYESGWTDL